MATAANTGSTLSQANGVNKTSTSISTNIILMVHGQPIAAVQTFQITEARRIAMVDEIGTDGHIDSVPNSSTNITGSCTRIRFDRLRALEAFSRGFSHIASQAYPFDIVVLDKQKRDQGSQISTVIKNVWFSNLQVNYSATDWVISDSIQFEAERIWSVLNGGSSPINGGVPIAVGGEIGLSHMGAGPNGALNLISGDGIVNIEQLADTGSAGRGGALDASGLIDIGSSGNLF